MENSELPAIRPYDQSLPMQLMRAREGILSKFRPVLSENGLTEQSWRVLRVVAEQDRVDITELSQRSSLLAASLSRILPRMEQAGLISRNIDPSDQRRTYVALAPAGRRLFQRMGRDMEEIYTEITLVLGKQRVEKLYKLLDEVIGIMKPDRATE